MKGDSEYLIDGYWIQHGMDQWADVNDALNTWDDFELEVEEQVVPTSTVYRIPHPEWTLNASCYGMGDTAFFGGEGTPQSPAMTAKQRRETQALCLGCPVRMECLRASLENREEYGIWAAVTQRDREHLFQLLDDAVVTLEKMLEDFEYGKWRKYGVSCG